MFSEFELYALVLCGFTIWLLAVRGRMQPESNWPLAYYLALVFYQKTKGEFLEAGFIYSGVVCAMMIRFEFMSQGFFKFFRFLESVCLIYVIWQCLELVLFR